MTMENLFFDKISILEIASCALALLVMCIAPLANAEDEQEQLQEELDQLMGGLESSGLEGTQLEEIRSTIQGMVKPELERRTKVNQEALEDFEEDTEGYGNAVLTIAGVQHQLRLTQCEVVELENGIFDIQAQKGPDRRDGQLFVTGGGTYSPSSMQYSERNTFYESSYTTFNFDGQNLLWEGEVSGPDGDTNLTLSLTCNDS